jgi:hypothetical protein
MLSGMVTIEYLHICDYAFPAEGGKPCVIGIFDVIHATTFPAMHPHMAIALRLRGHADEVVPVKIELARPNGDVLTTLESDVTVGQDGSSFIAMNMINMQFPDPGRYIFKVTSAGHTLISHSLQLHLQKMQTPPPAGPQSTPPTLH